MMELKSSGANSQSKRVIFKASVELIGTTRRDVQMRPNIEFIKSEMERHKWSGSQLAMKMGVSRMEVSRLLRGQRIGGKKCIAGLMKAFPDVPFETLFFLD